MDDYAKPLSASAFKEQSYDYYPRKVRSRERVFENPQGSARTRLRAPALVAALSLAGHLNDYTLDALINSSH
jgi:hypothetical protein